MNVCYVLPAAINAALLGTMIALGMRDDRQRADTAFSAPIVTRGVLIVAVLAAVLPVINMVVAIALLGTFAVGVCRWAWRKSKPWLDTPVVARKRK